MTSRHEDPQPLPLPGRRKTGKSRRWPARAAVVAVVLSVALLGATLACRADEPVTVKPANPGEQDLPADLIEIDLDGPEDGPPPVIRAIRIRRGQVAQINSLSNTVWVMIPSQYFSEVGGGSDWAIGRDMIAFKIDHGSARVKLSADFPESDEEQSIYFSILYFNGQAYYYQEGESPPRMIIPPTGF